MRAYEFLQNPKQEIISRLNQYGLHPNPNNLRLDHLKYEVLSEEIENYHQALASRDISRIFEAIDNLTQAYSDPEVSKAIDREKSDKNMRSRQEFLKKVYGVNIGKQNSQSLPQYNSGGTWHTKRPPIDKMVNYDKVGIKRNF